MPDISMCSGEGCRLKDRCYRYLAKPDKHWQSYANFDETMRKTGLCDAFIEVTTGEEENAVTKENQ